jgi:hypothetical protein
LPLVFFATMSFLYFDIRIRFVCHEGVYPKRQT